MLSIPTIGQVNNGVNADLMIDLSDYIKKNDAATKSELSSLTSVVANKLDAEPQHKHHIQDIKDLQEELQSKYDTSQKYSFNTIISDIDKIPYLEAPKIKMLEIVKDKNNESGYQLYVDESSGDLMIILNEVLIGTYTKSTNSWSFGGINMNMLVDGQLLLSQLSAREQEINQLRTEYEEYVVKTDAILKNHYDALILLLEKHDLVDTNTGDGSNVSTQ